MDLFSASPLTTDHKFSGLKLTLIILIDFFTLALTKSKLRCLPAWLLPGGSGEGFSRLTQVFGRIQLHAVLELMSPFPCWLL